MAVQEMADPLAGLPTAFVAHTAERFAKSYAADLHGLSAEAVATRCGVAIRTAFRLELSMPLPEAPAPCDEALRGKIAALRSRHPDLLRRRADEEVAAAYGIDYFLPGWQGKCLTPSESISTPDAAGRQGPPPVPPRASRFKERSASSPRAAAAADIATPAKPVRRSSNGNGSSKRVWPPLGAATGHEMLAEAPLAREADRTPRSSGEGFSARGDDFHQQPPSRPGQAAR